jgi:raffinose/stachyose/melibiose transport system permease protein
MSFNRYTWRTFARELTLIVGSFIFFIPVYLIAELSVKTTPQVFLKPLSFPTHPVFANYSTAWRGAGSLGLGHALVNSVIITLGSVVGLIVIGALCAYTIARRPSRLSTLMYTLFLLAIVVPFQLGVVPIYVAMRSLHLVPSYFGQILLEIGLLMPLTVFLYTGFVRALPREYEEAAQVDGAGMLRTFIRNLFPLLRPVTGTVAVLTGIVVWNDFFLPVIFLSGSHYMPLPVAVYSFVGDYLSQWNFIFAAVIIAILPILGFYLFAQRQLIRGFSGGIRG